MKFAVEKHWDKIAAGFALNEGGGVVVKDGKAQYVGVQASEKVSRERGRDRHGNSGPRVDSAERQSRDASGGGDREDRRRTRRPCNSIR